MWTNCESIESFNDVVGVLGPVSGGVVGVNLHHELLDQRDAALNADIVQGAVRGVLRAIESSTTGIRSTHTAKFEARNAALGDAVPAFLDALGSAWDRGLEVYWKHELRAGGRIGIRFLLTAGNSKGRRPVMPGFRSTVSW